MNIVSYLIGNWKRVLLTYLLGVGALFSVFALINSMNEPVYRSTFVLNPKGNVHTVTNSIERIFGLAMLNDTINFTQIMNLSHDQRRKIVSMEHDILEGDLIEIKLTSKTKEIIKPFYNSLIRNLNTDSVLNSEIFYAKKMLEIEMNLIETDIENLKNNDGISEPVNWSVPRGTGELEPMVNSSPSVVRLFLVDRLNNLKIQHFNLFAVTPISEPIIPSRPQKANNLIYFIFSNIIVLCLLFVQYLIVNNRQ